MVCEPVADCAVVFPCDPAFVFWAEMTALVVAHSAMPINHTAFMQASLNVRCGCNASAILKATARDAVTRIAAV
jgi:hypothetical protein